MVQRRAVGGGGDVADGVGHLGPGLSQFGERLGAVGFGAAAGDDEVEALPSEREGAPEADAPRASRDECDAFLCHDSSLRDSGTGR